MRRPLGGFLLQGLYDGAEAIPACLHGDQHCGEVDPIEYGVTYQRPKKLTDRSGPLQLSPPADGVHDIARPGPRHVRTQAGKFSMQRPRKDAEGREGAKPLALREPTGRTPRTAPYWPASRSSLPSSCFFALKACLLWIDVKDAVSTCLNQPR
jgi:hypothetical protein